jgi:hypothetical protein
MNAKLARELMVVSKGAIWSVGRYQGGMARLTRRWHRAAAGGDVNNVVGA